MPGAWRQYYDGGRSWTTTLGHDSGAFTDGSGFPGQAPLNGIKSAMGLTPFCTWPRRLARSAGAGMTAVRGHRGSCL